MSESHERIEVTDRERWDRVLALMHADDLRALFAALQADRRDGLAAGDARKVAFCEIRLAWTDDERHRRGL